MYLLSISNLSTRSSPPLPPHTIPSPHILSQPKDNRPTTGQLHSSSTSVSTAHDHGPVVRVEKPPVPANPTSPLTAHRPAAIHRNFLATRDGMAIAMATTNARVGCPNRAFCHVMSSRVTSLSRPAERERRGGRDCCRCVLSLATRGGEGGLSQSLFTVHYSCSLLRRLQ